MVSFSYDLKLSLTLTVEVADERMQNNNVCQSFLMVSEDNDKLLLLSRGSEQVICGSDDSLLPFALIAGL